MQCLWHPLQRDLLLLVVWKAVPCECDRSDLQHGFQCVCCFNQLPQLPAGPPLSDRTAAAGKVLFQALAVQRGVGGNSKRGETSLSPEAGTGGGAGGHVSLAILPSVTE